MNALSILAKAATPVLAKALTVAGKEVSKKALVIGGCTVGSLAVAGTTTGVVVHYNKKKAVKNVEDKVDEKLKAEEKKEEEAKAPEQKEENKTAEQTVSPEPQQAEATPQPTPVVPPTYFNVGPQPGWNPTMGPIPGMQHVPNMPVNIVNPAPAGPNPAFQFMNQEASQQQNVTNFPKAEEPKQEETVENPDAPVDNNDIVVTAADIAKGNGSAKTKGKAKQKAKSSSVEIPTSASHKSQK